MRCKGSYSSWKIYKVKAIRWSQPSEGANTANTLILGFWPPEPCESKFLLFNHPVGRDLRHMSPKGSWTFPNFSSQEHIQYPFSSCWMLPTHSFLENVSSEPSFLVGDWSLVLSEVPAGPEAHTGKTEMWRTGQASHGLPNPLHVSCFWGWTGGMCTDIQDDSWSGSSPGCLPRGRRHYHNTGWLRRIRRWVLRGS